MKKKIHKKGQTDGYTDGRTNGYGYIDSAVDADQEYIYFMGSATHPSACYAHLHKRNSPICTFFKYRV